MSIRIETLTSKTASDYKYSKNQTIGATEAGVDIGADQQGGSGESIIDDTTASTDTTYSSSKIEELIEAIPSGDVYSSAEHIVGKWIDGTSDVYERTFVYDNDILSDSNHVMDENLKPSMVKAIWMENGYFQDNRGTFYSGTGSITIVCADSIGFAIESRGEFLHYPSVTIRYVKK